MGMSLGQDPPKFHLISVPLVRCKPPTKLPGFPREPHCRTCNRDPLQPTTSCPRNTEDQNCHSSFPIIPQQCTEHTEALLSAREGTDFNSQYFNTIPFKANTQKKLLNSSNEGIMDYKDEPPKPSLRSNLLKTTQPIEEWNQHMYYPKTQGLFYSQNNADTQSRQPCYSPVCQNDNCSNLTQTRYILHSANPKQPPAKGERNCIDGNATETCKNGATHWLEKHLDQLYLRRRILSQSLEEAKAFLDKLLSEEMLLTGNSPVPDMSNSLTKKTRSGSIVSLTEITSQISQGLQDVESRVSGFMNRFKWRHSRRSKSAHERLPTDVTQIVDDCGVVPRAKQNNLLPTADTDTANLWPAPHGAISVVRGNEERADAIVPRRLLRWWRQNKRRSIMDEKRRQSMGFMSVHCPDSGNGLPPMKLRTRGSSMPPNENRANQAEEGETFGRSSNRASLRLSRLKEANVTPLGFPSAYREPITDRTVQTVNNDMFNTKRQIPPAYQFPNPINSTSTNMDLNTCIIEDIHHPFKRNAPYVPFHHEMQSGPNALTNVSNSSALHMTKREEAVYSLPEINPCALNSSEASILKPKNTGPILWTTVRCRPLCPVNFPNEKHLSSANPSPPPPPLPPRVTACSFRIDPAYNGVMATTRHQVLHPKSAQESGVQQTHVRHLSDGTEMDRVQHNQLHQLSVQEFLNSKDPAFTAVQTASHFEPIKLQHASGGQHKRSNAPHMMFHPIPSILTNSGFSRVRLNSLGKSTCSRLVNGYETCPQPSVLATQRVQSATAGHSRWDHKLSCAQSIHPTDEIWQVRKNNGTLRPQMRTESVGQGRGHSFRVKLNSVPAQKFQSIYFDNPRRDCNANNLPQPQNTSAYQPGVSNPDECNAALRECLRGWELTTNQASARQMGEWRKNFNETNPPCTVISPEFVYPNKNAKWTRLGTGTAHHSRSREFVGRHTRPLDLQDWQNFNTRRQQ